MSINLECFEMHNCKDAKEQLTELLLDGRAVEVLDQCGECGAELEALAATLRMTTRLRETVMPSESYWTNYHAELRGKLDQFHTKAQRLKHTKAQREELKPGLGFVFAPLVRPLRLCVKTFLLPIRVPLGVVLLILAGVLGLFMIRAAQQPSPQIPAAVVVQVPLEVPVIKERTVTQVVYRDRQKPLRSAKRPAVAPAAENTFAQFKPADDVKLTVIKGGSPNEK
jgi:hypothetical protein